MTAKVSSTGHLEIPAALRFRDGILAGQEFVMEKVCEGEYRLIATMAIPLKESADHWRCCATALRRTFSPRWTWGRQINSRHQVLNDLLLDTNVLSEPTKQFQNANAMAWLERNEGEWCTCSVALAEVRFGMVTLPDGKRRFVPALKYFSAVATPHAIAV
ncbi:MAG: hypothetical protein ACOYMN_16685 [Roseimicrobium sp.]